MLSVQFSPFPTLTTERLLLRQLTKEDLPEIHFLRSDERVLQYLDRDPETMEATEKWLDMVMSAEAANDCVTWAMVMLGETKLFGTICFWNIKKEHYRAEVGYGMDMDYTGRGLMHEAMRAVLRYGFERMKLQSVEANVNPANAASIRLMERNGFVREAYFKENYHHNGRFLDSAIYSLLKQDWRVHDPPAPLRVA